MNSTLNLQKKNVPLYFQLEQIIRSKILMGEFMPGEQIPTEKDFCTIYRVSSITARQAILNLVSEGLLVRRQGKGTFVAEGLENIKNIKTLRLSGDIHDIIPEGLKAQDVEVFDMIKMKPAKRVAKLLELEGDKEVVRIRRTRSFGHIPISYIINYLPLEVGERIKREDLLEHPLLIVLKNRLGIPLRGGVQYIEAVSADHDIASALSINICSPVLYLETTIYTTQKKPIDFVQTFYRPDQFRYTVILDVKRNRARLSQGFEIP